MEAVTSSGGSGGGGSSDSCERATDSSDGGKQNGTEPSDGHNADMFGERVTNDGCRTLLIGLYRVTQLALPPC